MAETFFDRVHKSDSHTPDVLSCLANLSNDEVFTPPDLVNDMLDILPQGLFSDPDAKFLDPACKTGVFLREIAKRLLVGLEPIYPDLQERIEHIFRNQLYGIAITELTSLISRRSLYCSKYPNSKYSVVVFDNAEGNIRFRKLKHTWKNGSCIFCGASQEQWDRDDVLESHAYEWTHISKPEEIFNMKFDVIISNPPYHLEDNGNGISAKPIYHEFVENAKKLNPRYMSMIIPARWYSSGKGLDNFRKEMLNDDRIRKIVDYENYKDVFPGLGGLAGGACYFLWDRDHPGLCQVTNKTKENENTSERPLNEYDIFIRSNEAISIVDKILKIHKGKFMDQVVSSRKPFGLPTNYTPKDNGIPCQFIQKIGLKYADKNDVSDPFGLLNKWKFIAPKSPIAGQTDFSKPVPLYYESNTKIIPPGTCCTESFIVLYASDSEEEVIYFKKYLFTKTVRFLILQSVVSQDVTKDRFRFAPCLDKYDCDYTDEMLIKKWGLSDDEWSFIKTKVGEARGEEYGD